MTTGLGFSTYELFKSLTKCSQAYRAFASEYGNASPQFAAFRDELERVEQAIRLQEPINSWTGQEYPGAVVFRGVLDESRHFAEKQRRVVDKGIETGGNESLAGLLQTALAAYEATLPRLQDRLVHNRVGLLTFNVTLLLQKSFHLESHNTLSDLQKSVAASGLSHERSTYVEQLLRKLAKIGSTYIRMEEDNDETAASQLPKPDALDIEFEGCMASVCALIGLAPHHLSAISVDTFAPDFSDEWWHSIVESAAQISRVPDALTSEPRTERNCRVKISVDGFSFVVSSYVVFRRCVFWRNEKGSVAAEHRLAQSTRKCFPYSLPRVMNKPLTLTFLELQDITIKGSKDRVLACKPRYTFLSEEDYRTFQADIRARELVHEYHTSSISHKNSRGADAHNECVKVWGPPTSSVERSISFPAVFGASTKNYEFPLKWFNPPVSAPKSTTVRLELAKEPGSSSNSRAAASGEKASSLKSSLKFMRRGASSAATAPTSDPSNASIRSVSTNMANSSYAPRELVDRLGYIDFKFATVDETKDFVSTVSNPFVAATPATWSSAPSLYAASSPSLASAAWSSPPLSIRSAPGQDVPNLKSAHGASPMSPTGMSQLPDAAMGKSTPVMAQQADQFDLPQSELGGLMIHDNGMEFTLPTEALTPSSLLRWSR